ncbi:HupE/UreJ family protein [Scytonema hofmannii FACHB-248]|uniref:HupE/UreJ family protein n=1 Tax=Scytonema hofmannii FACHB-248 TaxID=1842502 RepID=A0ABR8GUN4_9CYAN|nr:MULTISPECIES: HupE/UreJ family protein [Nostocales]MBD2606850.1 HupE/UreJ family protein [Scytonema hofmannii FACHB-248]
MFQTQLSNPVSEKFPGSKLLYRHVYAIASLLVISLVSSFMLSQPPAISNWFDGFLGGLAHPVLGLHHLVTVVAIGLLSGVVVRGALVPVAFVLATLLGTINHLLYLNIPGSETAIAFFTIIFAVMIAITNQPNLMVLVLLTATAGLFHGYTYCPAILETPISSQIAYMLGLTLTQYVVAMSAREIGNIISVGKLQNMRFTGFAFWAMGIVFLSYSIM